MSPRQLVLATELKEGEYYYLRDNNLLIYILKLNLNRDNAAGRSWELKFEKKIVLDKGSERKFYLLSTGNNATKSC